MDILNLKEALKLSDGSRVSGLVLMGEYSQYPTKNGGVYLGGNLQAKGSTAFKVWSGLCLNDMVNNNYAGKIVGIDAKVNEYEGMKSLILDQIYTEVDDKYTETDFMETKYNEEQYWERLNKVLKKSVSEKAYQCFNVIMEGYEKQFRVEFAAINHHDNCKSGLLAHTVKVVNMCSILKMYPTVSAHLNNDLLYVGAAVHDIGKVLEYSVGSISKDGKYISHNTLGILILSEKKDKIVELMGENFYIQLLAIIQQHHGEYGERPRTIAAYIVHLFDLLESDLAMFDQTLANNVADQVKYDGYRLI